jgi:hypothetical protein
MTQRGSPRQSTPRRVGQSRELGNQPEASDCSVRRFEFEKERAAWRTVKAVMCGRTPEINLFPERALGKVIKPVLMGNGNVPIHFGPLLYLLAQLHQFGPNHRKNRIGIKSVRNHPLRPRVDHAKRIIGHTTRPDADMARPSETSRPS